MCLLLKPSLTKDRVSRFWMQVITWSARNGHCAWLNFMLQLAMTSALSDLLPAIILQDPQYFADFHLVYPDRGRLGQSSKWADAAHAVPGVFFVRLFALAFVALEETRDEEFFGQRC